MSNKQPTKVNSSGYTPLPTLDNQSNTPQLNSTNINPSSTTTPQLKHKTKHAQRTTKTAQKLTLFPEDGPMTQPATQIPEDALLPEAEDLFDQLTHIPPERIGKLDRKKLPRVTAYCVANAYRFDDLIDSLNSRYPRKFDECAYVCMPSTFGQSIPQPVTTTNTTTATKNTLSPTTHHASAPGRNAHHALTQLPVDYGDTVLAQNEALYSSFQMNMGEVFIYEYGVVVFWGFREEEERLLLFKFAAFELESLDPELVQLEEFAYHYNGNYQPRIYNDIISLKNPANYMAKLTISHAIAQSTKLTLFEGLMEETISATKHIPQTMALTGKVPMSRTAITKKIGQLFIMRINVNLISNVLDVPELFWGEPALEPLYQAIRNYLEINQRVELLNQRVSVISDLLDMLKEHLTSSHGEQLEWIVIVLIGMEIVIGILTILFDYFSYIKSQKLN